MQSAVLQLLTSDAGFSDKAREALRTPKRRGRFRELDAARAQQALLVACDLLGQGRITWLIELPSQRVADTRFLGFGDLASHPVLEAWCTLSRGLDLEEALTLAPATVEAWLRDIPDRPAFGDAGLEPLGFLATLQAATRAQLPQLRILPRPVEVERYVRKREQDWDAQDRNWLPVSLMKKIMQVQQAGETALRTRLGRTVPWSIDGLHDDFQVVIGFPKPSGGDALPAEQRPTVTAFIQEACQASLHPSIRVTEASHARR